MVRAIWTLITFGTVALISEARPGKLPWNIDPYHHREENIDPYHQREARHNIPEFNPDNGAFFYPDQEFFDKSAHDANINHDSSDGDGDDFSGWYQAQNDDEDFEKQNTIATIARDPSHDRFNGPMNEFGPDNIIHDVFPHYDNKRRNQHHILEEEHFGNEINDIDKIDELTRRMEQMQKEMKKMQHMLTRQAFRPRWRK